jgi:hypothetical protein
VSGRNTTLPPVSTDEGAQHLARGLGRLVAPAAVNAARGAPPRTSAARRLSWRAGAGEGRLPAVPGRVGATPPWLGASGDRVGRPRPGSRPRARPGRPRGSCSS